ncbi:MAG TPA: hypothetical protein VKA19_15465 [Alphaproteobacteria bacterium]|nr:hypothetical protein [Alphaproteobacteria bacterium]
MTTADNGARQELRDVARAESRDSAGTGRREGESALDDVQVTDTRKGDRRVRAAFREVERRRSARRYSDRLAASFTSAFVAQWLGQEVAGGDPGNELALRRSANMVYAAVQEREAEYFRSMGQNAKKTKDYS